MNEDLRVIKTKQNLKVALLELLSHKSLEDITVTALCKQTGTTRRTFYLHYNNVPHFFEEFVNQLLEELEESIVKTSQERIDNDDQLEPKMINLFKHVYENKNFYSFIFSNHSKFAYYEMFFNKIKTLIQDSMNSLNVEENQIEFKVAFYANAVLGLVLAWYNEDFQTPIEEMNHILIKELTN
ncbi:TetR/AcrR family transcriptional regulator [Alkalibacillus haloalkaliphilus]|uniref:TetR family transcriptional regulator n=1 Tax=Alkalibacillus haloalkaliphilus TaxID=94136 RepID=A0A511W5E7_9BACI|nr:TetR-like C-terminal domain-containing protein [Alkalibacillus haloalkaliphilus]GEN46167.1 TetR family transcriptional regulator [Alkalibacillus haloalkaliphilus]